MKRKGVRKRHAVQPSAMVDPLNRQTAYHEAGHAVVNWMFGHWLEFVDMRGNKTNLAFVRHKPLWNGPVPSAESLDETARYIYRLGYQREMMSLLAGYAAESRIDDELSGGGWLDCLLGWGEWEGDQGNDMYRAVALAKGFYGDNGNAWRFLRRMASWTDDAMNHPRVWAAVEALAERLETVKTRISGGRVMGIMDKAWPESSLPVWDMGPKWRRRFGIRRQRAF